MDWVGEFFRTLPDVFSALWRFGDGWVGVGVTIGSIVMTAVFIGLAKRTRDDNGWASAVFGTMAATVAAWWAFGVLPSAWVYFVDSQRDLMTDTVIPGQIVIGELEVATNFYQVFRDSVVMAETTIAMVAFGVACLWIEKRFPRGLAEGEERGPTSGGYK